MLYPIETEKTVKVIDGGLIQCLIDMVQTCIKWGLIFFTGYMVLYGIVSACVDVINKANLSPSCISELNNAFNHEK